MADERWEQLRHLLEDLVSGFTGRIEYGNLRLEVYDGSKDSELGGRIAVAYETPGGSTNQFGVSFEDGLFHVLDAAADQELRLADPAAVSEHMGALINHVPAARRERLQQDIRQMLDQGFTRQQVLEELNRLLHMGTEFRGGSLTVDELTDACRYLITAAGA